MVRIGLFTLTLTSITLLLIHHSRESLEALVLAVHLVCMSCTLCTTKVSTNALKIDIHPGTSKQAEETAQYAQFNLIIVYMLTVAFINPTHAAYNHTFSKSLVINAF